MAYFQIDISAKASFNASIHEERDLISPTNGWTEVSCYQGIGLISGHKRRVIDKRMQLTVTTNARNSKEARMRAEAFLPTLRYSNAAPDRLSGNGWRHDHVEFEVERVSARRTPGFRHNQAASWAALCASDDHWWPSSVGIDLAFEAMRAFVAPDWTPTCTELPAPYSFRPKLPQSIPGFWQYKIHPIVSLADLRDRFAHLLLSSRAPEWKSKRDLGLDKIIEVKAPVYRKPPYELHDVLKTLLTESPGLVLTPQLNNVHADARTIYGIGIVISPKGFVVQMSYGVSGSYWTQPLAESFPGEPFVDTVQRAWRVFTTYLVPDYRAQIQGRREAQSLLAA